MEGSRLFFQFVEILQGMLLSIRAHKVCSLLLINRFLVSESNFILDKKRDDVSDTIFLCICQVDKSLVIHRSSS